MYRTVDCGTWDDPWFAELEPDGKLLFLYLLTNHRSTPCGCFEMTTRVMSFETGLSVERVDALLVEFGDKVTWWPGLYVIWVKNFYRRQMGAAGNNPRFRIGAQKALKEFPEIVRTIVILEYPELADPPSMPDTRGIDGPPIGHTGGIDAPCTPGPKEREREREREREKEKENINVPAPKTPTARYVEGFEIFWSAYPRKDDRKGAEVIWNRIRPSPDLLSKMLQAIDQQGLALKEPQYRPMPTTWLNKERWNDQGGPAPPTQNGTVDGMAKVRELENAARSIS